MAVARAHLRFLGHSTVLLELDGTRILTDPLLVDRLGPLHRHADRIDEAHIHVDAVLISHAHHDHLHLPSLLRVRGRPRFGSWLRGTRLTSCRWTGESPRFMPKTSGDATMSRVAGDRSYVERNNHERERLRALVERLDDDALSAKVNEHWTVAGVL